MIKKEKILKFINDDFVGIDGLDSIVDILYGIRNVAAEFVGTEESAYELLCKLSALVLFLTGDVADDEQANRKCLDMARHLLEENKLEEKGI